MKFQQVWPFFFFLFIPVILFLYLIRQKEKERKISTTFLWKEAYQSLKAEKPWEKFRHNLLMYLQILMVSFLIFALASPFLMGKNTSNSHSILVIDCSGSMNAEYKEKETRLDAAKKSAVDYVRSQGEKTRFSIVSVDSSAHVLVASSSDQKKVKETIENIEATDLPGNITDAAEVCRSLSSGQEEYDITVFSDTSHVLEELSTHYVLFDNQIENALIEYVSYSEGNDGQITIIAKIKNNGQKEYSSDVNLYIDQTLEQVGNVQLKPKESKIFYFQPFHKEEKEAAIIVELNEKDQLEADNYAFDIIREKGEKTVLLITDQNVFLEQALMAADSIKLYKTDETEAAQQKYDLYIFDNQTPEKIPEEGNLLFINPKTTDYFTVGESVEGTYLEAIEHRVTRYIKEYSFGVNEWKWIKTPEWADDFLTSVSGEYSGGFVGRIDGRTIAAIPFDIHQSELPLQSEFPLLIYGLLEECLETHLLPEPVRIAGEYLELYGREEESQIIIETQEGTIRDYHPKNGIYRIDDITKAGIYQITEQNKYGKRQEMLAINFPTASESELFQENISSESSDTKEKELKAASQVQNRERSVRNYFIIVAIFLILIVCFIDRKMRGYLEIRKQKFSLYSVFRFTVLRGLTFILLFLSLFPLSILLPDPGTTTIFLADVSDSMEKEKKETEQFISDAMKQKAGKDKVGIIAFGADTKIEQLISDKNLFTQIQTQPIKTATNLEKAVQTGLSMFETSGGKRLVLITDGGENEGDLKEIASLVERENIQVKVLKRESAIAEEVYVSNLSVPDRVKEGDRYPVTVEVKSNVNTSALLHLYSDDRETVSKEVEIHSGTNQFVFTDTSAGEGLTSYKAYIEPLKDTQNINNQYVAFTNGESRSKILLIDGEEKGIGELEKVLQAANTDFVTIKPSEAPKTIMEMNEYEIMILVNVNRRELPEGFMKNIDSYVKDYSGGLAAIGGEKSFALGFYRDTPLEDVLPVYVDLKGEKEIPEMAMVVVIDKSGSMEDYNGDKKMSLAKEAAKNAVYGLRKQDSFGVIAFDDQYQWVIDLEKVQNPEEIAAKIAGIEANGETNIYPALKAAAKKMQTSNAKLKHIILLTDGQDGYSQYSKLGTQFKKEGITVSTVAVGEGADSKLLKRLAENGGGRFYFTDNSEELPDIFATEVFLSLGEYIVNREFTPLITSNSPVLSGISKLPELLGYIATTPKELATVHLMSDTGDPILATWQHGLGRAAAFTTEITGKWTAHYAGTEEYVTLWRNLIDWLQPNSEQKGTVETVRDGNQVLVTYQTSEYTENSKVTGRYTDEEGNTTEFEMENQAPGVYQAKLDLTNLGLYSLHITREEDGQILDRIKKGIAMQYSKEYQFIENTEVLNTFIETVHGSNITSPDEIFDDIPEQSRSWYPLTNWILIAALMLFMIDVIKERFGFQWRDIIKQIKKKGKENPPEKKRKKKKENPSEKSVNRLDTQALLKRNK